MFYFVTQNPLLLDDFDYADNNLEISGISPKNLENFLLFLVHSEKFVDEFQDFS